MWPPRPGPGYGSAGCAAQTWPARQTFRRAGPGVLDRYQRRATRLTGQVAAVARELAGCAQARLLPTLGIVVSRHAAPRVRNTNTAASTIWRHRRRTAHGLGA